METIAAFFSPDQVIAIVTAVLGFFAGLIRGKRSKTPKAPKDDPPKPTP